MGEAATVLNFFDAERDPPRRKSMCRVRVDNRNTKHLPLPGGNIVEPGVSEILVYDDEVAAVEAQVERGDDKFALANQALMTAVALEVKDMIGWPDDIESLQKLIASKSDHRVNQAHERLLRESHLSFEGKFTDIFGRSPLPLKSAVVVERGVPEPQRIGMEEEKRRFVEVLKEAGIGTAPTFEKFQQLIADQVAEQVAAGVAAELRKYGIQPSNEPKSPPRKS